jgi:hypothetical protein
MSKKNKILERLKNIPKDFTYDELTTLLKGFQYEEDQGSGSRVKFINLQTKSIISLHKPHPGNILKIYQLEDILEELESRGVI